jgi:hypothetical protein
MTYVVYIANEKRGIIQIGYSWLQILWFTYNTVCHLQTINYVVLNVIDNLCYGFCDVLSDTHTHFHRFWKFCSLSAVELLIALQWRETPHPKSQTFLGSPPIQRLFSVGFMWPHCLMWTNLQGHPSFRHSYGSG